MARATLSTDDVLSLIHTFRGQRVILAADLAKLFEVETKRLNEQVRRNRTRFPTDFMFQLTAAEIEAYQDPRSQIATLKRGANLKHRPFAFTEHGALMVASVLNSPKAVAMSVYVVRAFVQQRDILLANESVLKRLAEIDKTLLAHNAALRDVYQKLLPLLQPPPEPERKPIGFRETAPTYGLWSRRLKISVR
jgi:hypothetical protein